MSKLSAPSLLVLSTVAVAAVAASVLMLVNPLWAAVVGICGLLSAALSVVLGGRGSGIAVPRTNADAAALEREAKVAAFDQMLQAANRCDELQKQLHDVRNLVSSVVLDVDGLRELRTDADREQAWLSLREDTTETLFELQQALDAPHASAPAALEELETTSVRAAADHAKHRCGVRIVIEQDVSVRVRGGQAALVAAMLHLAADAALAGRSAVHVDCRPLTKGFELRSADTDWEPSIAVRAHWNALATNSGGRGNRDAQKASLRVQFPTAP